MLRIITEQRGCTWHLELHGTIADEGIAVLENHWDDILAKTPSAAVKVDLAHVMFIDTRGQRLLRRMAQRGVTFDADGVMNRYVVEQIEGGL